MQEQNILCNGCMSWTHAGEGKCPYCGYSFANTNPAGTLAVNTVLQGRYTLGKCLGIDGEGILYAAADGQTQRRVSIKEYVPVTICSARTRVGAVLPRPECEVLFKTTRMDFVDLYRALISIGPMDGLVRVYDLFEANNTAYVVRDPDSGTTLGTYLQRRDPLFVEDVVDLLRPVFHGVEELHRKGVLHRGISPETIWIGADGRARLSGFATMGLRTADSELRSQLYNGYAAPEQYAVAEFDGKYTDVYGLGAVVYLMLTGQEPQAADRRRIQDSVDAPRSINGEVPVFVSRAVMRALRMMSTERIQSAPLFLQALITPDSDDTGFRLSPRQMKALYIGGGLLLAFVILLMIIIFATRNVGVPPESSGSQASSSSAAQSSSTPAAKTFVIPSMRGEKYTAMQSEYLNICLFEADEQFSSEFEAGVIVSQSPVAGTELPIGSLVKVVVSLGTELIPLPDLLNRPRVDVKADLQALGIKELVYPVENDGTYQEDYVVRAEIGTKIYIPGMLVNPTQDTVMLYVAKAPATPLPTPVPSDAPVATPLPDATENPGGHIPGT